MGHWPQNITADQLKKAIGQKDAEGKPIPVFVGLCRVREDRSPQSERRVYRHLILVDGWDGERVAYRDPGTKVLNEAVNKLISVPWEDLMEVWDGTAVIPVVDGSPS